ncbi:sugar ABC transporter ATP-binding protein [Geodermatophilus sp. SYSU D00708]
MTAVADLSAGVARLAVSGISKSYPGTQALADLDLDIMPGEIHGIAGQNGAGKSTLVRILSGVEKPDGGAVLVDGAPVSFDSPHSAQQARIYTVFQELSLMPSLSVAENIHIGDLPRTRLGTVDWRTVRARAREALRLLGFDIDVRRTVESLPIAHRQAVEIAKAVGRDARILILDEPTATLPRHDVRRLFDLLRRLREQGLAVIFISHHFDEMYEICDRISVFRDGRKVGVFPGEESSHDAVLQAMLGNVSAEASDRLHLGRATAPYLGCGGGSDEVALEVRGLRDGQVLNGVDLTLHRGEVLGFSGLIGNGQSELASCLFGARPSTATTFVLNGVAQQPRNPAHAIRLGLGLLPEERKSQGLVLDMSVANNVTMASLPQFTRFSFLHRAKEVGTAARMRESLAIKARSVRQPVVNLSGGNQQKVALAKWLVSGVQTLVFVEPTRGVDVGAKLEIYELIQDFVARGGSAVLITSEIDEALMCDRVAVLRRGTVVGVVGRDRLEAEGESAILDLFS